MTSENEFGDVLEDLKYAIGENNFRITGINEIGESIASREGIDFPLATVVHFCNLTQAQTLLEIEPGYLLHMPCRISLWQENGRIVVEARLVPTDDPGTAAMIDKVNNILKEIVRYAAGY